MSALRHRVEHAAVVATERCVRLLPHTGARVLGRAIGRLAHAVLGRHRRIAEGNLARALPDLPERERRRIARACFEHFGLALLDALSSQRFDSVELCRRLDIEGWEHLQEAERRAAERDPATGVVLLTAHLGVWEVAAYAAGLYGGPVHVIGRPLDNPLLDRKLVRSRARFGNRLIPKRGAIRPMMKVLARGERVGILIDQRARPGEGIWVPFFGLPAYSTPVLARIALRTGAPVVPVFGFPAPEGRYRIVVRAAIWPDAAGELAGEEAVVELTRIYLAACEAEIREHPGMWLWMHERWKDPARGTAQPDQRESL
jgi:KDO2-lipid IV(A) lauroyltransferase